MEFSRADKPEKDLAEMNKYLLLILFAISLDTSACSKQIHSAAVNYDNVISEKKDEFNYLYSEGLRLKLLGERAEAIKCFEKCFEIDTRSDASLFQIGQVLLLGGDPVTAKNYFLKAYSLDKNNKWYSILLMRIYEQLGNRDSMSYYLGKSLELDKDNYELRIKAVELTGAEGDNKKYRDIIQGIVAKYGLDERTGMSLIKSYLDEKNYEMAENVAVSLVEMYPDELFFKTVLAEIYVKRNLKEKAKDIFDGMLKEQPGDIKLLMWYSDFLLGSGEYKELFTETQKIIKNTEINETEKINLILKIIDNDTIINEYGKDCEEVINLIETVYPKSQPVALLKSAFYEKTEEFLKLEKNLKDIILKDRRNYFAWEKLMMYYADRSDWNNLFLVAGECSREFNMSYPAKILYANAALEKGEYNIAVSEAGKARILAGEEKEPYVQAGLIEAEAYYRKGDNENAFRLFEEMIIKDPDNNILLNNYAYYLAENDLNLDNAKTYIEKVIKRDPGNNTFLDTYAWVLFKSGKSRKALKIMLEIIGKGNISDPEYYEHTGYIYKKLGKCKNAVEMWQKALEKENTKVELVKEIEKCRK